jgi:hypothetical protein
VRIVFAVEPTLEPDVRRRISSALSSEHLTGPDGALTRWQLLSSEPAEVQTDEQATAEHLLGA